MIQKTKWLIFGVGSPETRFLGTRFNVGAAVVDLLADRGGGQLVERGPIQSEIVSFGNTMARLAKPNVIPEMAEDAIALLKKHCPYEDGCVALIYGDPDYLPGQVKIKRKGGASGHKIICEFNQVFGTSSVVRVRVGMGRVKNDNYYELPVDVVDEHAAAVARGIQNASMILQALIADGYSAAIDVAGKANKNRGLKSPSSHLSQQNTRV